MCIIVRTSNFIINVIETFIAVIFSYAAKTCMLLNFTNAANMDLEAGVVSVSDG